MSRIGKQPIDLPENVEFDYSDSKVTVKGPKGTLQKNIFYEGEIKKDGNQVIIVNRKEGNQARANHGLVRALINNMVIGVSAGFSKTLKISGVGYKAQLKDQSLDLSLGFSHNIE